jgi:hypothetical protein
MTRADLAELYAEVDKTNADYEAFQAKLAKTKSPAASPTLITKDFDFGSDTIDDDVAMPIHELRRVREWRRSEAAKPETTAEQDRAWNDWATNLIRRELGAYNDELTEQLTEAIGEALAETWAKLRAEWRDEIIEAIRALKDRWVRELDFVIGRLGDEKADQVWSGLDALRKRMRREGERR